MRNLLISSALLLTFLCYSEADAQTRTTTTTTTTTADTLKKTPIQDTFGIGSRVGYIVAHDAESGAWFAGLHSRYRFGPVFGLELAVDYQGQRQFIIEGEEVVTENRDVSSIPVTASALIHAPLSEYFVPYGIAGAGLYFSFYDADDISDSSTDLGYHLGAGFEIPASYNLAFHFDGRYVFLDEAAGFDDDLVLSGAAFTAGITFYFREKSARTRVEDPRRY